MPAVFLFDPSLPLKSAMNSVKPPRFLSALLSGLVGILVLSAASPLVAQIPAGDLTVTVEETENGDVRFSLSGTAFKQRSSSIFDTNTSFETAVPPANAPTFIQYAIPPGLNLTVPAPVETSEPETPEEGAPATENVPLTAIQASTGNWYFAMQSTGFLPIGSAVTGSGSITTGAVPFSFFVPGTYVVGPPELNRNSEVEEGGLEDPKGTPTPGNQNYFITYKVIPLSSAAGSNLGVSRPTTFVTRIGSSTSQTITITNLGNTPISGLKVEIPRSGRRNFDATQPRLTTLAAGASTTFVVTFEPESPGSKRASFTVTGGSASKTVPLRGRALDRVNSPRFPRRP
jgi:hypothetical protein